MLDGENSRWKSFLDEQNEQAWQMGFSTIWLSITRIAVKIKTHEAANSLELDKTVAHHGIGALDRSVCDYVVRCCYPLPMKRAFLLSLLATALVAAASDIPIPWDSVSINFGSPAKESVKLTVRKDRLTEVLLRWNGSDFVVPASEFASVPNPQLNTVATIYGQYYGSAHGDVPYLLVEMRYGTERFGEFSRAQFLFHSGRYQELILATRVSERTWQDMRKLPGKKPTKSGTVTTLE